MAAPLTLSGSNHALGGGGGGGGGSGGVSNQARGEKRPFFSWNPLDAGSCGEESLLSLTSRTLLTLSEGIS